MKDKSEKLEEQIDVVFDRIKNITYYTANTAKDIIIQAHKLEMAPAEYLAVVNSYIQDFDKVDKAKKEGISDENH